jgi:hypothetical protein
MDLRRTGQLGNKEVMELLSRDSRWRITPREDCVKMVNPASYRLCMANYVRSRRVVADQIGMHMCPVCGLDSL